MQRIRLAVHGPIDVIDVPIVVTSIGFMLGFVFVYIVTSIGFMLGFVFVYIGPSKS
jgi:hypothetical protein